MFSNLLSRSFLLHPLTPTPSARLLFSTSCLSIPQELDAEARIAADSTTVLHLLRSTPSHNISSALLLSNVTPTPSLISALLPSLSSLPSSSLLPFSLWSRPHLPPPLLSSLVDLLAKSRSFHSAWSLLLSRPPSPLLSFVPLFRRYARAGHPSAAVRTFRFLLRHPEYVAVEGDTFSADPADLLIDALCKEGHTRAAAEFVASRRDADENWVPSVRVYNVLIHGWFRARRIRKAERLWAEMQNNGVRPTVVTYGTLIEGLCRMRRPDQAVALLDEMITAGIEPNSLTCNPIVDSLAEAGRFKDAHNMLEKFPLYGVSPDISTFNSLVKGFCKNGDLVGASKMLKMMIGRGILPTATTYNYFFRFFSKFGKIEEGMNLYTKMIHSGYSPDCLTYHLLIKMLCEKDKLDLAVQMIREMNRNGFESDLATSTMLVHLLCRIRRFEEAFEEFESMFQRGIVPQYITYKMLKKEFQRLGLLELEKQLVELMKSVPHSTRLPGTYRDKEGDESVKLRKSIMRKAQVISDALKECKDPKELVKLKSSTESALESANRLIADIRRRVYGVQGE
ncbi:uncharacterized protein [Typha angustifolia]|uniref:uncharacterized protein n=1 Tax=Typha angustifolia TaxID=59011 RepID=UPI003C2CA981